MAFPKDSCIIEIHTAEDGYFLRVWKWPQSPPPVPYRDLDAGSVDTTFRQDRVSTTKTELKGEFDTFIDSIFDV